MIIPDQFLFIDGGTVNMEVAGFYEITYQGINDPSGNDASAVTRYVQVTDTEDPIVTLNGLNPEYVDLEEYTNDASSFSDPGAFAQDNLFVGTTDSFSTDLIWEITISEMN